MWTRRLAAILAAATAVLGTAAHADEGMWTFDNFPRALVAERHGVNIDAAWLERVRLATARLSGCTASFVSADGLLLTNHHCVEGCLAEHSSRERSLNESGLLARERTDEIRCSTQIADVLVDLEDITARVAAATRGLDDRAAKERRRQTLTNLEQSCEDTSSKSRNPLKCEAVTLYGGGQYWLYRYRRYTDVRLVFTPEDAVAAFGGDPDNFQFPRWCLDMALLRAYVAGRPARTPQHLKIDFDGPDDGDTVLVAGHPVSTDRQLTVAELQTLRNDVLPPQLLRAAELRGRYLQFAKTSDAATRIGSDPLDSLENSLKVQRRLLDALLDDEMLAAKRGQEAALRTSVARDPKLSALYGDPWARIEAAQQTEIAMLLPYTYLEDSAGFSSRLFRYARTLVRGAAERPKTNAERLREYRDTALPRIEQNLAGAAPVYPELEQLTLSYSLERMREWLGPDHPVVRRLLATESPDSLAAKLIGGSKLADPAVRLALWNGGQRAVDASDDAMIELARSIDAEARALRKRHEDEVEAPVELASEQIAAARFASLGTSVYPDATFTLRLSVGTVRGWDENGAPVAPFTTLDRLFERATGRPPFAVPERWLAARPRLNLATRVNLASDNDIVGGNSGSPLLNSKGDIVGLIFDGNIHSISGAYWFDDAKNRAVAVDAAYIREALTKVYGATNLVEELSVGH
ncbi:MAG TPA: S46 family peptidase [Gammaproteobacteria bacterium]|nr:S46 family peptidase [Gammaproteobacteria bacterium]